MRSSPARGLHALAWAGLMLGFGALADDAEGAAQRIFGGRCDFNGFTALSAEVPSKLAEDLGEEFVSLGQYHGLLDTVRDNPGSSQWRKATQATGSGSPTPADSAASPTPALYMLNGEVGPEGPGRVSLKVKIVSYRDNNSLFSGKRTCEVEADPGKDRECLKALVEEAFASRIGKILDEGLVENNRIMVLPIQSDYLDRVDLKSLYRHFVDVLACDTRRTFLDYTQAPPPLSAILPGSQDLDRRGMPMYLSLAMARDMRAGTFLVVEINKRKDGKTAMVRFRTTIIGGYRVNNPWQNPVDIPRDSSLGEYEYLLSKGAYHLFRASCQRRGDWFLKVPFAVMPAIPRVSPFLGEGRSESRKDAFVQAQRPAFTRSGGDPDLIAFSPALGLARQISPRCYMLFAAEWTRLGNFSGKTTYAGWRTDTLPAVDEITVLDGPEQKYSWSVSRYQALTGSAGLQVDAFGTRTRDLAVSFSAQFIFGLLQNTVATYDSSFRNQTRLTGGIPMGKDFSGEQSSTVADMWGPLVGASLGADLRLPAGRWFGIPGWAELGVGAKFQYAWGLEGKLNGDTLAFDDSFVMGYSETPGRIRDRDVEWVEGNLYGTGQVLGICPSGGTCRDYRGEPVGTRTAGKTLLLPYLRFTYAMALPF